MTQKKSSVNQNVIEHLRETGAFLYKPNPGNAGDALIAAATIQLFEREGLEWDFFSEEKFEVNQNVVYGGGGAFVSLYQGVASFIEKHHNSFKSFTLLPHSVNGHEEILASLDGRFCVFARELKSYDYLLNACSGASVKLGHDMALELDLSEFKPSTETTFFLKGQSIRRQMTWQLHRLRLNSARKATPRGVPVHYMRTDEESKGNEIVSYNADLSDLVTAQLNNREQIFGLAEVFLSEIRRCKSIETDRLHVAVGAGVSDISCVVRPGSYYKIKAIYEHSLRGRFPSVTLSEWSD